MQFFTNKQNVTKNQLQKELKQLKNERNSSVS